MTKGRDQKGRFFSLSPRERERAIHLLCGAIPWLEAYDLNGQPFIIQNN
jgi:hypothetical protein